MPPEGRAPDTDGYDISEVRGDLRFSPPFIPILSPAVCFLFFRAPSTPPPPVLLCLHPESSSPPRTAVVSLRLLRRSSSLSPTPLRGTFRPRVSLARFISPPRSHPIRRTYIDSPQRLGEEKKEDEEEEVRTKERGLSLSLSLSRRIVLLFAVGLLAPFE